MADDLNGGSLSQSSSSVSSPFNGSVGEEALGSSLNTSQEAPPETYQYAPTSNNCAPIGNDMTDFPLNFRTASNYTGNSTSVNYSEQPQNYAGQQIKYSEQPHNYAGQTNYSGQPQNFAGQQINYSDQPQNYAGQTNFPDQLHNYTGHTNNSNYFVSHNPNYADQSNTSSNYAGHTNTSAFLNHSGNYSEHFTSNPRNSPQQAWASTTEPNQISQRKSLDETLNQRIQQLHKTPPPPPPYQRGHRRGRSDEVGRAMGNQFNDNQQMHGRHFNSPPPTRANPQNIHLSRSTNSLENPLGRSIDYNNMSRLPHSMSVDTPFSNYLNDRIYKQTAAFVGLTKGITQAQRTLTELDKEVLAKERELYKMLSVQENPTEKDYRHMKDEVCILHREIEEMYQECDRLDISTVPTESQVPRSPIALLRTPLQPPRTPLHTPSPNRTPVLGSNMNEHFPKPGFPLPFIPIKLQTPITQQQPPAYETINDPVPPYGAAVNFKNKPFNSSSELNVYNIGEKSIPPPIPPRPIVPPVTMYPSSQPNRLPGGGPNNNQNLDEHWECRSCTFMNLLVAECEVCYTPRPTSQTPRHT